LCRVSFFTPMVPNIARRTSSCEGTSKKQPWEYLDV
jgi:hypothetical protein